MKCLMSRLTARRMITGWAITISSLLMWAGSAGAALPKPLTDQEKEQVSQYNAMLRRPVEQVLPAVVAVQVAKQIEPNPFAPEGTEVPGVGSGVIIDPRGYVITNNHVVADTDKVTIVLADGRSFEAKEKMYDPDTDLAVIKIDPQGQDLPAAILGDSDKVEVGHTVIAMGNPFNLTQTVTRGIVSFKGRQYGILSIWGYEDFIQTDAAINKGNSGGPLVNLYGEVIGINSNIMSPTGTSTGYGFAVPSNLAKFVSDQLIAHGKVKRGWLGVRMHGLAELRKFPQDFRQELLKEFPNILDGVPESLNGVLVLDVNKGGPSDQAGIKSKDVFLEINGTKTADSKGLRNYIATLPPGTIAHCLIWRDGREITLDVNLGDRDVAKAKESESRELHVRRTPPSEGPAGTAENKGKIGIAPREFTPELAKKFGYPEDTQGVLIEKVIDGSLAERCGLKAGDVILAAAGEKITSISQLRDIINKSDLDNQGLALDILNAQGRRQLTLSRSPNL
jgi:serine protease Do